MSQRLVLPINTGSTLLQKSTPLLPGPNRTEPRRGGEPSEPRPNEEQANEAPNSGGSSPLSKRLLRGGAWVFASRVLGIGLSFGVGVVLARKLPPTEFGLFLLTLSIVRFCVIFARLGLDRITMRFVPSSLALDRPQDTKRILLATTKLAALSLTATCIVTTLFLSLWGNHLFGVPISVQYLSVCVSLIVALSCLQLIAEAFRSFHELRLASLFDGQNSGPLINVLMIVLLFLARDSHVALLTSLIYYTVSCVAVVPFALVPLLRTINSHTRDAKPPPRDPTYDEQIAKHFQDMDPLFSNRLSYQILGLGLPALVLTEALGYLGNQAPIWIASSYSTGESLSLFVAARQLVHLIAIPLSMLNLAVASTIPELFAQGKPKELQRVLQLTTSVGAIPSLVAIAVMLMFPKFMLATVFGEFYAGASGFLVIFCIGHIVLMLTGSCDLLLILTGHQRPAMINALVFAAALFVLGCGAAHVYGLIGLTIVSSVIVATSNITLWLIARRSLGIWTHANFNFFPLRFRDQ